MGTKEFLEGQDNDATTTLADDFDIEITTTKSVPHLGDGYLTYDNFDLKKKKCKIIETCVLFVDIRDSVRLNASQSAENLAKIYSSFIRSMAACANYHGGHVRNIVGDRVMVVFDTQDCYKQAVNTAVMINSVCKYILKRRIPAPRFRCGIGIDYGSMLVMKGGTIRRGTETEFYRSLVWLGRAANIASRLTDLAYKTGSDQVTGVQEAAISPLSMTWYWTNRTAEEFLNDLNPIYDGWIRHRNPFFKSFLTAPMTSNSYSHPPILMTQEVFLGLKRTDPDRLAIKQSLFARQSITLPEFNGAIYGGDVIFKAAERI